MAAAAGTPCRRRARAAVAAPPAAVTALPALLPARGGRLRAGTPVVTSHFGVAVGPGRPWSALLFRPSRHTVALGGGVPTTNRHIPRPHDALFAPSPSFGHFLPIFAHIWPLLVACGRLLATFVHLWNFCPLLLRSATVLLMLFGHFWSTLIYFTTSIIFHSIPNIWVLFEEGTQGIGHFRPPGADVWGG